MCYDQGTLTAYLDGELTNPARQEVEEHVKSCPSCRGRIEQLTRDRNFASAKTEAYLDAVTVDTDAAWVELDQGLFPNPSNFRREKGVIFMLTKYRKVVAAGAAVAVLGFGLTFAPVRAFADNLLNIFRINQVQSLSLNPGDIEQIQTALHHGVGKVTLGDLGQVQMSKTGRPGTVPLTEAGKIAGFQPLLPAKLPTGYTQGVTRITAGGTINFTLNTQKTNAVLKELGATTFLPSSLNGKTFTAKIPVLVRTTYQGANPLVVAEARSPELTAPGNADVGTIRDAILALPFLPNDLRQELRAVNDWQHTLVIPSLRGTSQNVTVAGVPGVYMTTSQGLRGGTDHPRNALIWQKNGIVYGLLGNFTVEQGLNMADSMR
ncbi:hypothetical protein CEB3_c46650 [Peptococcaceae bacterium CEB3]|nr:hypothetical protein CEB3_c46650 [Peptococcaceae bacterium CEB3]